MEKFGKQKVHYDSRPAAGWENIHCSLSWQRVREFYRDQWIYNLILSKEGNDFYIILPGWHPNGVAEEGRLEFHKFKKVK